MDLGNCPDLSGDLGNTITKSNQKRITASKRWCFTLNNYTEDELFILSGLSNSLEKAIVGKETCPDTGTPHLQGFLKFKKPVRPVEFTGLKRGHFEKAKGKDEHQQKYCSKEGEIFLNIGFQIVKDRMKDKNWYVWETKLMNVLENEPDERKIYWIWGSEGCKGKTTFAHHLCLKHDALMLGGKGGDMRYGVAAYTAAKGHTPQIILCNIPRSNSVDFLNYEAIENVKDMLFFSGKYEGCMICGNIPHVVIFANEEPCREKLSEDRWEIWNLDESIQTLFEPIGEENIVLTTAERS